MISTTFLLVRHAHADWIPDEMRPLSEEGRGQALALCRRVEGESPVAIYSSPYTRARQSVEPLAERLGLPIEELHDLRERSLTLDPVDDWEATIEPTWTDFSLRFPAGGETNAEAMDRARRAFESLRDRHLGEVIVVATHGNLLVLMLRLLDASKGFDFWRGLSTPDLYRLEVPLGGHYRLERLSIPA